MKVKGPPPPPVGRPAGPNRGRSVYQMKRDQASAIRRIQAHQKGVKKNQSLARAALPRKNRFSPPGENELDQLSTHRSVHKDEPENDTRYLPDPVDHIPKHITALDERGDTEAAGLFCTNSGLFRMAYEKALDAARALDTTEAPVKHKAGVITSFFRAAPQEYKLATRHFFKAYYYTEVVNATHVLTVPSFASTGIAESVRAEKDGVATTNEVAAAQYDCSDCGAVASIGVDEKTKHSVCHQCGITKPGPATYARSFDEIDSSTTKGMQPYNRESHVSSLSFAPWLYSSPLLGSWLPGRGVSVRVRS